MKRVTRGVAGLLLLVMSLLAFPVAADCPNLADGRINDDAARSCAAPVIIYDDPLELYGVNPATSQAILAFTITDAEIEAAGIPDKGYVTIAEGVNPATGKPIAVYRLATGEFQMNSFYPNDEGYVVVWDEEGNHYAYTFYLP
ncbi:MAG: hypothetical protein RIC84_01160 [Aggregatilineales bacterium]